MKRIPKDIEQSFFEAKRYEDTGDEYNAIKLYKRIVRKESGWLLPFLRLGFIYKQRGEWKPSLHYYKKAVAISSSAQTAWWDLGIAATALRKRRLARSIWNKFGYDEEEFGLPSPISIRLAYDKKYEILWGRALDPARCLISSIPQPASGFRFRDILLFDQPEKGSHLVGNRRFPVFESLGLYKRSHYRTYSCVIREADKDDVDLLEQLCREADIGFEVWSNATRHYHRSSLLKPEYYHHPHLEEENPEALLIALAARRKKEALGVLASWEIISLKTFDNFKPH